MRRMLLILAHEALRRALHGTADAAGVPFGGRLVLHRGPWCLVPDEYSTDERIIRSRYRGGLTRDWFDEIERGRVVTVAVYWNQDGGGRIIAFLANREVTGEAATTMAREYDAATAAPAETP